MEDEVVVKCYLCGVTWTMPMKELPMDLKCKYCGGIGLSAWEVHYGGKDREDLFD